MVKFVERVSVSSYDDNEYNRHRSGNQVVCITWDSYNRVRVSDQIEANVKERYYCSEVWGC